MATTNLSIRMDAETKRQAEQLFGNLGMSISTAFNIFVKQSLRVRGIPFSISENIPGAENHAALREALEIARDPKVKGYSDVEEALRELKK